jgi:GMP synthase (glutamine-hydrolysing)
MKILVINNHGQYNHRIYRSLHYLKIPSEIVPNSTSIKDIKKKEPLGLILGGGPSIDRSGNSMSYVEELDHSNIRYLSWTSDNSKGLWWRNRCCWN